MSSRPAIGHLDIVLEEQCHENHFDFVSGEEATGASMAAISKHEVRLVGSDKLVARILDG